MRFRSLNLAVLGLGVLLITFAGTGNIYAAKIKVPKTKVGALYHSHATGNYTIWEQTTSSNQDRASDNLVGFGLFAERIFLDRFGAGIKLGYGLERNLSLTVGSNTIQALEAASFWSLDFKAFVRDHTRPGLKPFLGVGYGNYTTQSTLSVISGSGTVAEDKTGATIPFTSLSAGMDYTFGMGGFRLEGAISTGKRTDLDSSSTYFATYDYTGAIFNFSVYSFF